METEDKLMIELQACRECDVCRTLMDDSACLLFLEAKTEFKERYGLNYRIRILENVERMGKLCGVYPGVSNFLLQNKTTGKPEQLLTDCLSCRMQFNQTTPSPTHGTKFRYTLPNNAPFVKSFFFKLGWASFH